MTEFPDWFPEGCPPAESTPAGPGSFVHLISDKTASAPTDFQPLSRRPGYRPSGGKGARCKDCALSVFDGPEAAANFLINFPSVRTRILGEVYLPHPAGVMLAEGAGHPHMLHWWLPDADDFRTFFRGCLARD